MKELLCLVSGFNDSVLGEIIKRLLRDNDIKFHECSGGYDGLVDVVNDDVSYVVVGMGDRLLPLECREIFDKNNNLIIVELLDNGKSLGIYLDNISETTLNMILNIKN